MPKDAESTAREGDEEIPDINSGKNTVGYERTSSCYPS